MTMREWEAEELMEELRQQLALMRENRDAWKAEAERLQKLLDRRSNYESDQHG
jgi:hypothetical protein